MCQAGHAYSTTGLITDMNSNQITLPDASTLQLINQKHPFSGFDTIPSTYEFQLKSDDTVTPMTFTCETLYMAAPSMLIYGRNTGSRQKRIIISLVFIVLIRIPLSIDQLAILTADCCITDTLVGLHISNMVLSSTYL